MYIKDFCGETQTLNCEPFSCTIYSASEILKHFTDRNFTDSMLYGICQSCPNNYQKIAKRLANFISYEIEICNYIQEHFDWPYSMWSNLRVEKR